MRRPKRQRSHCLRAGDDGGAHSAHSVHPVCVARSGNSMPFIYVFPYNIRRIDTISIINLFIRHGPWSMVRANTHTHARVLSKCQKPLANALKIYFACQMLAVKNWCMLERCCAIGIRRVRRQKNWTEWLGSGPLSSVVYINGNKCARDTRHDTMHEHEHEHIGNAHFQ